MVGTIFSFFLGNNGGNAMACMGLATFNNNGTSWSCSSNVGHPSCCYLRLHYVITILKCTQQQLIFSCGYSSLFGRFSFPCPRVAKCCLCCYFVFRCWIVMDCYFTRFFLSTICVSFTFMMMTVICSSRGVGAPSSSIDRPIHSNCVIIASILAKRLYFRIRSGNEWSEER
jgi:hypothetical protein